MMVLFAINFVIDALKCPNFASEVLSINKKDTGDVIDAVLVSF